MMFTNDMNSRIRITEDGNNLFHVERNCYLLSSKQSIWPWKPLRYEEHWSTLPIVEKGPFDSFGKAVKVAKEYIGAIRSKVVLEATFSSILDGTAFGEDKADPAELERMEEARAAYLRKQGKQGDDASPDDYDREGGAE